jgi:Cu/Ag efflux pump CusA
MRVCFRGNIINFARIGEAEARSKRDLVFHSLIAGAVIILLLFSVLGRYQNVLLILLNMPFVIVGSVLTVLVTGRLFLSVQWWVL